MFTTVNSLFRSFSIVIDGYRRFCNTPRVLLRGMTMFEKNQLPLACEEHHRQQGQVASHEPYV
uniref:Bacteriophage protein n=1 Tax=Heterorhabditis bacteriophora TaxID=37862 RepID=A0A1I7WWH7_HETBA